MSVTVADRREVRRRAGEACEYCRAPQAAHANSLQIEHIRPRQHDGSDGLNNLALACPLCNRYKGPNLTGVDPRTDAITILYHPRQQAWPEHFRFDGVTLVGLTPVGRVTVRVLQMNSPEHLLIREVAVLGDS